MVGNKKGVYGRIIANNPHVMKSGCICHLVHLAAKKGSAVLPVQIDDLLVDIFYHFRKSDANKKELKGFQVFYDTSLDEITKHCTTRWLGLGPKLVQLIGQWELLRAYFKQELSLRASSDSSTSKVKEGVEFDEDAAKVARKSKKIRSIEEALSDKVSRMCVLFLNYVIPKFEQFNLIFQSREPRVHILRREIMAFLRKLQVCFVKASSMISNTPFTVDFNRTSNQKDDNDLLIGSDVRAYIIKHKPSEKTMKTMYDAIRQFYVTACNYIKKTFPINDNIIKHAEVADTTRRLSTSFADVRFFLDEFPFIMPPGSVDDIEEEFNLYLLHDFPDFVVKNTGDTPKKPYCERQDKRWVYISKCRDLTTGNPLYRNLSHVMLSILSIPVSQAAAEREFSIIRKTYNENRCGMSIDTLEALLTIKNDTPCYEDTWTHEQMKEIKGATNASLSN